MSEPRMIAGRYTLLRQLGVGAMGTVWLARDETLHRQVAIKQVLDLSYRRGKDAEISRMRAMREGRVAARLNHPNAVSIYDAVIHDDEPWLVMEYVPSRTLTELVQETGVLSPQQAAAMGAQLADALAEAHRVGIVHRDVKPGNVLLTKAGKAKITDFGIARGGGDTLTETGLISGTPAYFAPEIARGADPGPASDVWSLGATLYFAVEATPPFGTDDNPLRLLGRVATRQVPAPQRAGPLGPVLDRLLSRSPDQRPSMAMAHTLLAAVGEAARISTSTSPLRLPPIPDLSTAAEAAPTQPAAIQPAPTQPAATATAATKAAAPTQAAPTKAAPTRAAATKAAPTQAAANKAAPTKAAVLPAALTKSLFSKGSKVRTARLVPAAAVAVLALVALGWYLLAGGSSTRQPSAGALHRATSGPTVPSVARPAPSPSGSAGSAPNRTSSPPPSTPAETSSAPMQNGTMTQFVADYYNLLPANQPEGWRRLGPTLKRTGYQSYTNFWSTVRSVNVRDLSADPGRSTVTATVVFVTKDGRTSVERHAFELIPTADGTGLLINTDTLLRG